mgnify:FL=1
MKPPIRFKDFVAVYKARYADFLTFQNDEKEEEDPDEIGFDVFKIFDDFQLENLYSDVYDSDLPEQDDPEEVITDSVAI